MNLHGIANAVITAIHPNETCTVYQSLGQKNIKGVAKPFYREAFSAEINIQPLSAMDLQAYQNIEDVKMDWKCYLHSDKAYPIAGVKRLPTMRTGDFIQRDNGRWLLITTVMEDWNADGWCCVGAVEQVTPPTLTIWKEGGKSAD